MLAQALHLLLQYQAWQKHPCRAVSLTAVMSPAPLQVRAELAPWEKKIGEVSGRVSVAASERDALARKAEDAKKRLDAALKVSLRHPGLCENAPLTTSPWQHWKL